MLAGRNKCKQQCKDMTFAHLISTANSVAAFPPLRMAAKTGVVPVLSVCKDASTSKE